jgi:pimeloyl-ACP methyl ester carboxylesterase/DNA-binding CsgD family transcriptional regulator
MGLLSRTAYNGPERTGQMSHPRQKIRFLRSGDGLNLAWAEAGSGPVLVKAANWMTHLELEWESPVWSHWLAFLSKHFRYVRYDERGCGLTGKDVGDLSVDQWAGDLSAVIDAAQPDGPLSLLGISQGAVACIAYAVEHPERVSRMILYGGYARGFYHRGNPAAEREYQVIMDAIRVGWGKDNPAFRQLFTSRFMPEATPEQVGWFNELCRRTTTAEIAAELLELRGRVNIVELLPRVKVPTLIIHADEDGVVPLAEGRLLAAGIHGAQFVELNSKNHVLLEEEPAWRRFCEVVLEFCHLEEARMGHDPFESLSRREREILELVTDGLANAEIGERLSISEKTVRNHISNIYDKLGVWSRAQAIVFARDHQFRAG